MKKILSALVSVVFFLSVAAVPVLATVTVDPASGNVVAGQSYSFTVAVTSPPATAEAVQLRLTITGGSFTNFEPDSAFIAGAQCSTPGGNEYYYQSEICVDLASGATITSGETLGSGTFVVDPNVTSPVVITKGSENLYVLANASEVADTGTAATFTIGSTGGSNLLPDTAIFDNELYNKITYGIALIWIGALGVYLNNKFIIKG